MTDTDDFQFMNEGQLLEEIDSLTEEIEQDECLRGTSDFHHVSDRLSENQELLQAAQDALEELRG